MSEQRYLAVLSVIRDGDAVTEVASRFGVSRKTLHVVMQFFDGDQLLRTEQRTNPGERY